MEKGEFFSSNGARTIGGSYAKKKKKKKNLDTALVELIKN